MWPATKYKESRLIFYNFLVIYSIVVDWFKMHFYYNVGVFIAYIHIVGR